MTTALDLKCINEADKFLDKESQLIDYRKMGERLFTVFGSDKDRVSSQIRNLQQIAVSVRRFSDIEVFVKNQMGKKSGSDKWRQVGIEILSQLEGLRAEADRIATDEGQRLAVRAYLARGWVKAIVGAYLYAKAWKEMNHV